MIRSLLKVSLKLSTHTPHPTLPPISWLRHSAVLFQDLPLQESHSHTTFPDRITQARLKLII